MAARAAPPRAPSGLCSAAVRGVERGVDAAADAATAAPGDRAHAAEPPAARAVQVVELRELEEEGGARKQTIRGGRPTADRRGGRRWRCGPTRPRRCR
jgi:hypothetical protein